MEIISTRFFIGRFKEKGFEGLVSLLLHDTIPAFLHQIQKVILFNMKSILLVTSIIIGVVLGIPESEWATNPPTLDTFKPIYLGTLSLNAIQILHLKSFSKPPPNTPLGKHPSSPPHE